MSPTEVQYQGDLTFQLYRSAQLLHLGKKAYLFLLLPIFVVISSVFTSPSPSRFVTLVSSAAGLLTIPLIAWLVLSKWKKIFNTSPYLHHPFSGRLGLDGFTATNHQGTANIAWNGITDFKISDKLMLLYQGPMIFHVVSTTFFSSPAEWELAKEITTRMVKRPS